MRTAASQEGPALPTHFAPAERASQIALRSEAEIARTDALLQAIASCVDGVLMILNRQRQVLVVNQAALDLLGIRDATCLVGQRSGEILNCVHVPEGPGGCGTSQACRTCGAVLAILASQAEGRPVDTECLATVQQGDHTESAEFRVRATPVRAQGEDLTALLLTDISGEKRRAALEHVFFHDILNTIGGLRGWASLMAALEGLDQKQAASRVSALSQRLEQEVRDQRRLLEAEQGTLALSITEVPVAEVLAELRTVFAAHEVAKGRHLRLAPASPPDTLRVDASLLVRVLTNMVKNAFEACAEGETVSVLWERGEPDCVFRVHNPGVIPADVVPRIFTRSFSTKGTPGRGLGTYSMKLFGERYLGGKVGFASTPGGGTTFYIRFGA